MDEEEVQVEEQPTNENEKLIGAGLQQKEEKPQYADAPEGYTNMVIKTKHRITIAGQTGSGKSNLLFIFARWLLSQGEQVLIIDPLLEYGSLQKHGAIVQHITHGDIDSFNAFVKGLFGKFKGMILIDEADAFFPNKTNLLLPSKQLIHIGRHYGIGIFFVTRRLANLHSDCVSQSSKLFFFRLNGGADMQYLDRCMLGELKEPCSNLEEYHFVSYDLEQPFDQRITINEPVPEYTDK